MGFFSKFKAAISGPKETEADDSALENVRKEMRSHTRYPIANFKDTSIKLSADWSGAIMDISYGGIAVRFDAATCDFATSIPVLADCELTILGSKHQFQMKTVRTIPHNKEHLYVGFCFNHSSSDTLIFLRDVIEPIRHGRTLEPLSQEFRVEKYRGKHWHCFRGDGPIDLLFQTDATGTNLLDALVTFKSGDHYFEVGFANGRLWTGKSADKNDQDGPLAVGSRMIPSAGPDEILLRRAYLILTSAPVNSAPAIQPLLETVSSGLKKNEKGAA